MAAAALFSSLLQDVLCKNPYGSYNSELWCFPFHDEFTWFWVTVLLCGGNNGKIAGCYRKYKKYDIFLVGFPLATTFLVNSTKLPPCGYMPLWVCQTADYIPVSPDSFTMCSDKDSALKLSVTKTNVPVAEYDASHMAVAAKTLWTHIWLGSTEKLCNHHHGGQPRLE